MTRVSLAIAIGLHVVILAIAGWDLFCGFKGRTDDTVSSVIRVWASAFPLLPLVTGLVLGHLFWCQCESITPPQPGSAKDSAEKAIGAGNGKSNR